jgi:hypothetical protein
VALPLCLLLAVAASQDAQPAALAVAVPEQGAASALTVRSPLVPKASFELVTCETVLEGDRDLGMHLVAPKPADWDTTGGKWAYRWDLPEDLVLAFEARPDGDSLRLSYTLANRSKKTAERLQIHPCLPMLGAPGFYPGTAEQSVPGAAGRGSRLGKSDYTELWARLFLWSREGKFAFRESALASTEKHLAFLRRGATPIAWSWWKNDEKPFDLPLIAAVSKDEKHVVALAFQRSFWASSNAGDARACIHLFPYVGTLAPGESATVSGRLYVLEGGADAALARFHKDFPKE